MIKRLRAQFIVITMSMMAVLLAAILIIICQTTGNRMEKETLWTLESATQELEDLKKPSDAPPERPNDGNRPPADDDSDATRSTTASDASHKNEELMHEHPVFVLYFNEDGELEAMGHSYYDLSDYGKMLEILQEAIADGEENNVLYSRSLHYLRFEDRGQVKYVFSDIAGQRHTLRVLRITCLLIFLVAMAAFFAISWWLSRLLTRPVERAWNQQKQFIADASHELKTPLTVILANAEMLQAGQCDEPARRRLTDGIVTTARQMRGVTQNMLELARSDNHTSVAHLSETFSLSELTEKCTMYFEPVYFEAERELLAEIAPNVYVRGDRQRLYQVLEILLDNGQKYSEPGSRVELTLKKSRNHCTLQISSRGKTLTAQQCRDIFRRFYRVDESRSRDGSCGLGLAIASVFIQEHRGKIWAQGKDGINTFFVTLPLGDGKKK